jgi:hypothetical protein
VAFPDGSSAPNQTRNFKSRQEINLMKHVKRITVTTSLPAPAMSTGQIITLVGTILTGLGSILLGIAGVIGAK